jgi:L-lysine exporter family protein LysE/ArgO
MPVAFDIFIAGVTGFVTGLVLSIPVGPVNLTIINEGARRGFFWAALIGLGAMVAEVLYCAIAFTSFATLFTTRPIKEVMEVASFAFILYLGIRFLRAQQLSRNSRLEERLEDRFHPHSAFMVGFVRVAGNPGVLLYWIILSAHFLARDLVPPTGGGKLACTSGVAIGTGLWFLGLSYAVSLRHRKLSEAILLRMEHGSGICLVVLAIGHGIHILWKVSQGRF